MIKETDKKYIDENAYKFSLNEIWKYFNGIYTKIQIKNYCNNNTLEYRKLTSDERSISCSNKKLTKQRQQTPINHDYFKTWSRNMAYIFGLWCADGYIGTQNKGYQFSIKLHKNDKYLLQQILNEMKSEHKIYENKENCCCFTISSKTIYNDIINLGGCERKSLRLKFPYVPNEYLFDFIRGYFDGDGCTSTKYNGYILGTKEFCYELDKILKNNNICISGINQKHPEFGKDNNCYVLGLYKKAEFKKFTNLIYQNINNDILYLNRKKERNS